MRNVELVGIAIVGFEALEKRVHVRTGVLGLVEKPLHVRLPDSREVIAYAQVEHDVGRPARQAEFPVQRVNQHPGARVLLQRLVNLEFLRPLDVIAFVLHIDAGLRDVEFIQGLHGLELDITSPAKPGCDDVLRHLRVRPRGRAERGADTLGEHGRGVSFVIAGQEEMAAGDPKDGIAGFEFPKNPRKQPIRGYWLE